MVHGEMFKQVLDLLALPDRIVIIYIIYVNLNILIPKINPVKFGSFH
jgi:hypothetical protein